MTTLTIQQCAVDEQGNIWLLNSAGTFDPAATPDAVKPGTVSELEQPVDDTPESPDIPDDAIDTRCMRVEIERLSVRNLSTTTSKRVAWLKEGAQVPVDNMPLKSPLEPRYTWYRIRSGQYEGGYVASFDSQDNTRFLAEVSCVETTPPITIPAPHRHAIKTIKKVTIDGTAYHFTEPHDRAIIGMNLRQGLYFETPQLVEKGLTESYLREMLTRLTITREGVEKALYVGGLRVYIARKSWTPEASAERIQWFLNIVKDYPGIDVLFVIADALHAWPDMNIDAGIKYGTRGQYGHLEPAFFETGIYEEYANRLFANFGDWQHTDRIAGFELLNEPQLYSGERTIQNAGLITNWYHQQARLVHKLTGKRILSGLEKAWQITGNEDGENEVARALALYRDESIHAVNLHCYLPYRNTGRKLGSQQIYSLHEIEKMQADVDTARFFEKPLWVTEYSSHNTSAGQYPSGTVRADLDTHNYKRFLQWGAQRIYYWAMQISTAWDRGIGDKASGFDSANDPDAIVGLEGAVRAMAEYMYHRDN